MLTTMAKLSASDKNGAIWRCVLASIRLYQRSDWKRNPIGWPTVLKMVYFDGVEYQLPTMELTWWYSQWKDSCFIELKVRRSLHFLVDGEGPERTCTLTKWKSITAVNLQHRPYQSILFNLKENRQPTASKSCHSRKLIPCAVVRRNK